MSSLTVSSMAVSGNGIGTLLGSTSTSGSNSIYSLLGDYNTIKSGSYGKLMSAYFSKIESSDTKKSSDSTSKKTTDLTPENATLTAMNDARSLSDSVDALQKKGLFDKKTTTDADGNETTSYDTDAIYSAVKDFVNDYNDMVSSGSNSSTSGVKTNTASMTGRTQANKSSLSAIGISVKSDGSLSLDEDTFKKSDMSKVQTLFGKTGGYASMVKVDAQAIDYYAQSAISSGSLYSSSGSYTFNPASTFSVLS